MVTNLKKVSLMCITVFALYFLSGYIALATQSSVYKGPCVDEQKTAIHLSEVDSGRKSVKPKHVLRPLRKVIASWYGKQFNGKLMANGKRFNMYKLTAAHKSLPFGTRLLLQNPQNGKKVLVTITDRGPYVRGRDLDLSKRAAEILGIGVGPVTILEVIDV